MLLKNKVAVIYGAGGAIGGVCSFSHEGAKLFLTGRRLAPVEAVGRDIDSAGETVPGLTSSATRKTLMKKEITHACFFSRSPQGDSP